ncbi:hypothetical protein [Halogeometricum luteum]|uniref:Hydrogenase maturation nickel metallochaperone HypA n=1 Tax=Halogeometricum luteum TaxID=2950537 RepID=A0ABU2FZW0_9EURY|nr:hypothetical protein [Halogeometricum sp. S3BR5-2]MDS0293438.1 hypothetical protein [Halogeometricum sp. S3BR5-2]
MVGTKAIGRLLRLAGVGPGGRTESMGNPEFPYVCRGCGTAYDVQYHVCPECGGFSVERLPDTDARIGVGAD